MITVAVAVVSFAQQTITYIYIKFSNKYRLCNVITGLYLKHCFTLCVYIAILTF